IVAEPHQLILSARVADRAADRTAPRAVSGSIWKDGEEYVLVRRSEWEAFKRENTELRQQLAQAQAVIKELKAENVAFKARVAKLEEKLRTSSKNSSKPPSSDPPWAKQKPKRRGKKGKRKRGAQKGHEGKARTLLPPEEVDDFVDCPPPEKCDCGGHVVATDDIAERKQVFELPKVKAHVTEYRFGEGVCENCGKVHRSGLPDGVPTGMLGPRATALVGVLAGKYRMSKRYVKELLSDLFGFEISLGSVSNTEARVSEALAKPVEEAGKYVREQAVAHMDETGYWMAAMRAWLWVVCTPLVSVFAIRFSRGSAVAKEMLGEAFRSFLVSDRWSAYNWVDVVQRQLCWAHLIRDFTKISERSGQSGVIGNAILDYAEQMFELWYRVRDGPMSRADFQAAMVPIRQAVEELIEQGVECGHAKTSRTCKRLLKVKAALWTFVDHQGIEPTNNFAEQIIRLAVMWRRVSFGTQSERGNRFVERMLTVTATCRQQDRNVLDYVTAAVEAKLNGTPAPSLLPDRESMELALAS
ncbi:MAG: IS66 family transposase, partial [Thermodesulfobacteriota bacterium]|nr:IS66 family transposase [Thermodesulfobacteriota bacterium]